MTQSETPTYATSPTHEYWRGQANHLTMTAESEGLFNPQLITTLKTYGWQIFFAENKALSVAIRGGGTELGENLAAPVARSRSAPPQSHSRSTGPRATTLSDHSTRGKTTRAIWRCIDKSHGE